MTRLRTQEIYTSFHTLNFAFSNEAVKKNPTTKLGLSLIFED